MAMELLEKRAPNEPLQPEVHSNDKLVPDGYLGHVQQP